VLIIICKLILNWTDLIKLPTKGESALVRERMGKEERKLNFHRQQKQNRENKKQKI